MTDQQLARKWIKEMQELGFTPDDMLRCIKLARKKYKRMCACNKESETEQKSDETAD